MAKHTLKYVWPFYNIMHERVNKRSETWRRSLSLLERYFNEIEDFHKMFTDGNKRTVTLNAMCSKK